MSFLTSICVSDIGSIPQNGLVDIFTDSDNYTTPIQTNVPISGITGNNCPYYLSVPSGTTLIHIDYNNSVRICLDIFDPCTSCNLGFTDYLTGNTATISVGVLTGSCATITDYVINWYGPDENIYDPANPDQNIVFTSGEGTLLPWQVPHPLNEPVLPGFYQPVISQVIINGTTYSLTGGTGTVQSNLNCLYPSVVISAWTCDNGVTGTTYSHEISYSAMGGLLPPPIKQIRLDLKPTTKFLPIYFRGYTIPDTLKMVYYGTAYTQPIILEYVTQGYDVSTNWIDASINTIPKKSIPEIVKIISLTGLTRSNNDYVVFEVIPNNVNYNTDFELKTTCLETVDCDTCVNNFKNSSYKIFEDSITGFTYIGNCGYVTKNMILSGCSTNSVINHNFFDYTSYYSFNVGSNNPYNMIYLPSQAFQGPKESCYENLSRYVWYNPCRLVPGTGTIETIKTTVNGEGQITLNFTDYNDLTNFYNDYLVVKNYFSTPPFDPTTIGYYKYFELKLSNATGYINCGDSTSIIKYKIHQSSTVVTGTTSSSWTMQISMPIITNQITFTAECTTCNSAVDSRYVNPIAESSLSPDFYNISYVGARYENPFPVLSQLTVSYYGNYSSYYQAGIGTYNYFTETLPYSGDSNIGYTFLRSLSSDTCGWVSSIRGDTTDDPSRNAPKTLNFTRIDLINPSNIYDMSVYVYPVSGHTYLDTPILVYTYSAGTRQYIDTNYIIPAY